MYFLHKSKKLFCITSILGLTTLLAGCSQSKPIQQPESIRPSPTTPIGVVDTVEEYPPINYAELPEKPPLIASAATREIARIEVTPPSTILTHKDKSAAFFVEAFDNEGYSLGRVPYNQLIIEGVGTDGAVVKSNSSNTFNITIPKSDPGTRNISIHLKEQPNIIANAIISNTTLKPNVLLFTDSNLTFPKITTNYETAPTSQIEDELGAFSIEEYVSAIPNQANQLNMPLVIRTSKAIHEGSIIHIGNSVAIFGKVATIESRGEYHLITLDLIDGDLVVENFEAQVKNTLPAEVFAFQQPATGELSAQMLQTDLGDYCTISGDIVNYSVEAPINLLYSVVGTETLSLNIAPKISVGGVKGGGTIRCKSPSLESPLIPLTPYLTGILSANALASAEITNELDPISLTVGVEGTYDAYNKTDNGFREIFQPHIGGLSNDIDGAPGAANISTQIKPQFTFSIYPLNPRFVVKTHQILQRLAPSKMGPGLKLRDTMLRTDITTYISLNGSIEYVNASKAFNEITTSSAKMNGKVGVNAKFGGGAVDWLQKMHITLPAAQGEIEFMGKKSEAPKLHTVNYEDNGGNLDINLVWTDNSKVESAILGDKNHHTDNSLHKETLGSTKGIVDYDKADCIKGSIVARVLGYGAITWNDTTLLENAPIGTSKEVKACKPTPKRVLAAVINGQASGGYYKTNSKVNINNGVCYGWRKTTLFINQPREDHPNYPGYHTKVIENYAYSNKYTEKYRKWYWKVNCSKEETIEFAKLPSMLQDALEEAKFRWLTENKDKTLVNFEEIEVQNSEKYMKKIIYANYYMN